MKGTVSTDCHHATSSTPVVSLSVYSGSQREFNLLAFERLFVCVCVCARLPSDVQLRACQNGGTLSACAQGHLQGDVRPCQSSVSPSLRLSDLCYNNHHYPNAAVCVSRSVQHVNGRACRKGRLKSEGNWLSQKLQKKEAEMSYIHGCREVENSCDG